MNVPDHVHESIEAIAGVRGRDAQHVNAHQRSAMFTPSQAATRTGAVEVLTLSASLIWRIDSAESMRYPPPA